MRCTVEAWIRQVHSGEVNSGHYYAFIRPKGEGRVTSAYEKARALMIDLVGSDWFRFDDDSVTRVSEYAAVSGSRRSETIFVS